MTFAAKIAVAVIALMVSATCAADQKSKSQMPDEMQCPVGGDPACTGTARAGVRISVGKAHEHSIFGDCEMIVAGKRVRPCSHIHLILDGVKNSERHTIEVTGRHFEFKNLSGPAYRLESESPQYQILTGRRVLIPGQKVKIKLRRKPKK